MSVLSVWHTHTHPTHSHPVKGDDMWDKHPISPRSKVTEFEFTYKFVYSLRKSGEKCVGKWVKCWANWGNFRGGGIKSYKICQTSMYHVIRDKT